MSEPSVRGRREEGAVAIEYVMILGFITAAIIFFFRLLYPAAGQDIESLINAWGDRLAAQIAGEEISKSTEDAWGSD